MFNSMQQAFDETCIKLAAQGQQAVNLCGNCQYLTDDGLKCAVGVHLTEAPSYNDSVVYLINTNESAKLDLSIKGVSDSTLEDFWTRMQQCHDTSSTLTGLKSRLTEVAHGYALDASSIEVFTQWDTVDTSCPCCWD